MNKNFDRKIILEDGSVFEGYGFGSREEKVAEIVFNTSMVGYQEILSDRSYTDQAVVMTYPLIGNYGICADDYESDSPMMSAMIVREICGQPSNFRSMGTLEEVMKKNNIAGVYGIDTRMLTRHIRNAGSMKAIITDAASDNEEAAGTLTNRELSTDQVNRASCKEPYTFFRSGSHSRRPVVVIDCGIKKNILNMLKRAGRTIEVVPWNTPSDKIMQYDPSGIFISNGPGDPESCRETTETIGNLKGRVPIFGICLGHQIISLAYGAKTYKLKFGHRGGNHPVKDLATDKIEITSQNHSYAVVPESLKDTGLKVTHVNLLDDTVEGVECTEDRVFSVQYHPESAPGPCDSAYLFDKFFVMLSD